RSRTAATSGSRPTSAAAASTSTTRARRTWPPSAVWVISSSRNGESTWKRWRSGSWSPRPPDPAAASVYAKGPLEGDALGDRLRAVTRASTPTFELFLPDRPPQVIGGGEPRFSIVAEDEAGVAALESLDELRIGEA